jgi:hypothetical protein
MQRREVHFGNASHEPSASVVVGVHDRKEEGEEESPISE